jgi:thiamine kinase-like enzyme
MGELLGAYERESLFYDEVAPQLPVRTPRMYYGAFDRDRGSEKQKEIIAFADGLPRMFNGTLARLSMWIASRKHRRYIILMEDLSHASPGDQLAGAEPQACERVLETMAALHAKFWGAADLDEHFWLMPHDIDARMRHGMFLGARETFGAHFSEVAADVDEHLRFLDERGVEVTRALSASAPGTLIHCDLRLDNLFFDDDGVILFDWQLVRRGPAAYDVAYFLSSALAPDSSPELVSDLLRGYHVSLMAAGVDNYDFAALQRDYDLAVLSCLQTLSTVDQVDLGEGRGKLLIERWMQRLGNLVGQVDLDSVL